MIGTTERTASSKYQITLVDKTDKSVNPLEYPRQNKFFDNLHDRNTFIKMFESAIIEAGGKLVHNVRMNHPVFTSFDIFDKKGNLGIEMTVYH